MIYLPNIESLSSKQGNSKRRFSGSRSSMEGVRPMLESFRSSKSTLKASVEVSPEIKMTIESPPLVCYGAPKESTGALLSGLIHLDVKETQTFESFTMSFKAEVLTRRPVSTHCRDCAVNISELHKWTLIAEPVLLKKGIHTYPFSYLVPGHLPATNNNTLSKITYSISALAMSVKGDEIKFKQPITIQRAILPGLDRHSIRVFPPTNLCASVKLPPVVHPGGDFPLEIRLDGVVPKKKQTRWRLRKVSWRIDENCRVVSPACKSHSNKLGGDGKGLLHEDSRIIGSGELKSGWKSDFEAAGGKIEMQFMAGIPAHAEAACDIDSPCGIVVSHNLVIELIVAEEHCPTTQTRLITPTGAARVLRMQFRLAVSDRGGLGISWDEETPPMYENVPEAPPHYAGIQCGDISEFLPPDYEHSC
ncbi:uncharacterized protein LAJ45_07425 [Morchella importuna]|nr:uncharacterized protein LAJ45_07425 [Morchella importuna]KAH8148324.1 hypothetical protein LAJ45_07425 [Morchella importuna]